MDEPLDPGAIVERTPHALIAVDGAGVVRFWNAGAETLYGHGVTDALGQPWATLFGVPLPDGPADTTEVVRRCRNGALIYVQSCRRPLPVDASLPTGVLFSDPWMSPIAEIAEIVIICSAEVDSPFDSMAPAIAQMEALVVRIVARDKGAVEGRIGGIERLRAQNAVTMDGEARSAQKSSGPRRARARGVK